MSENVRKIEVIGEGREAMCHEMVEGGMSYVAENIGQGKAEPQPALECGEGKLFFRGVSMPIVFRLR